MLLKRALKFTLIGICLTLALQTPAFAYHSTYNKSGSIVATRPFQSFDNFNVGDCQYESAANLVLFHWPKSTISTAQVLTAWEEHGDDGDPNYATNQLWISQDFLMSTGFAGHKASSVTEIPQSEVIQAADSGGVEVTNMGPVRMHMFDMIKANSNSVWLVDDGYVFHYTWKWFLYAYTQQGEVLEYYSVKWS